ncbi:MAG: hypothetical protein ACTSPY_03400 [Candidatus Helarchaeota archaeon]
MAMFIPWKDRENLLYVLLFIIVSTLFQIIIITQVYYIYPISSYAILILVPIGTILGISTSMVILTDYIYERKYFKKQSKIVKEHEEQIEIINKTFIVIIASLIVISIHMLLLLSLNFAFIDPIWFHGIPVFEQFTLSQTLSSLIILIAITILKELQIAKKVS